MMFTRKLIHKAQSQYGKYKIIDLKYDGRPARVLYGESNSPQSGIALDDNPELIFDYNQRFLEMVMSHRPNRLLVIGGGAFMLPTALFQRFPGLHIDVVEIDQVLVDLSYEYFSLPRDDRLRVHVDDGARFVATTKEKYDMIIIDAFTGYTIPHHLLQHDTITQYRRILKKNGVLALNFISEYKPRRVRLAHEIIASFGEVFPALALYPSDKEYPHGEEQNFVLAAGTASHHFEYLDSTEYELYG
jgi:spermidine synthase